MIAATKPTALPITPDAVDPHSVPKRTLYTGAKIPVLGLGTFGSDRFTGEQIAEAVLGAASVGYRHFDCASVYGNEQQIGHSLRAIVDGGIAREDLWVTSKLWNDKHGKADVIPSCEQGVHHDNFDLWNSTHHKWNAVKMGPHRDVVGDWQRAAKKLGLRFGVSEHLGASFTWFQDSHRSDKTGPLAGVPYDGADPKYQDLYHFPAAPDDKGWYSKDPRWQLEWFARIKDLVD